MSSIAALYERSLTGQGGREFNASECVHCYRQRAIECVSIILLKLKVKRAYGQIAHHLRGRTSTGNRAETRCDPARSKSGERLFSQRPDGFRRALRDRV